MRDNPIRGRALHKNPHSQVNDYIRKIRAAFPEKAALLETIARKPKAFWLTGRESLGSLPGILKSAQKQNTLAVFVIYYIHNRDLGGHSRGGAESEEDYLDFIKTLSVLLDGIKSVIILEPDALAHIKDMRTREARNRILTLSQAVKELKSKGKNIVYIDAGNPRWHTVAKISRRLKAAGIAKADGFALNVSNFITTEENIAYGNKIAVKTHGKHFVIDTSRNGNGAKLKTDGTVDWCNPKGRRIGDQPTTTVHFPLVDALLWIKCPGESDGECNGGPKAGVFWPEYALGLVKNPV